jgi:molybdenum cofactor cytidylyltransferase
VTDAPTFGLVLAAGRSTRMGRPKALLTCPPDPDTFVARIVRVLRDGGVDPVVVVVRPDDNALQQHVRRFVPDVELVENPHPDRGQLSSLLVGLDYAQSHGARAIVVMPVDVPQVRAETVAALLRAAAVSDAPILRVVHGTRHGHPVLFRDAVFDELRHADPSLGAKAVVRARADETVDVHVDDPGVLRDVDVPDDYAALFGSPPRIDGDPV